MKKIFFLITASLLLCAFSRAQSFNTETVAYIDSGKAGTDTVDTKGNKLAAIIFSDSLDGTQVVVYTASSLDSTFYRIQRNGADVSLTFADNKMCGFTPADINQCQRYVFFYSLDASNAEKKSTRARWFKIVWARNF